ncbi:MAG: hypothetical protein JNL90_07435 [Planctomycetes bacterium]|nr:hypothetical protein [Planctomycetota bacterium]
MSESLSRRLAGLFRSKSDLTSVKALEKAGVRSVNVLDLRQLEAIVGEVMESALRDALASDGSAERAADGARIEFLRRLGLNGRLAERGGELAAESEQLAGSLTRLRDALDQSKAALAERRATQQRGALDELRERLDALLDATFARQAELQAVGVAPDATRGELRSALLALLEAALCAGTGDATGGEEAAQVELLERRVKKLNAQLLETQALLARTQAEKEAQEEAAAARGAARPAAPPPSATTSVAAPAADSASRKALMREIFAHNLELRRTLGENAAEPGVPVRTEPRTEPRIETEQR